MAREEIVEIQNCKLAKSTDKAGLFEIDGAEFWIPWSQVKDGSIEWDGEEGSVFLRRWLAEEKGII
jgi:hypothetical protein